MITITVISQNAQEVVLQGVVVGHPELTFTSTIDTAQVAADPGLLMERRDLIYARLNTDLDNWTAAQSAILHMSDDELRNS